MLLSVKWLKEITPYEGEVNKLAHVLTMLGLEVEEIFNPFEEISDIIVGYVVECGKHPNADKLKLCKVDIAQGELLDVVCGAPNVEKGQLIAFAPVGAKLPGNIKIKKAKIRGQTSYGMICSEMELGLSDDHSGIMVIKGNIQPGTKLIDALDLDTCVFDIGMTPNRADCLSVLGVAREVAAYFDLPLNIPPCDVEKFEQEKKCEIPIEIEDPDDCPLYMARILEDVKIKPSPDWMKYRLVAMGVRPINNVVDITNYVLLELGHPLHGFDMDLLKGHKIRVQRAKKELEFTTLDGKQRRLSKDALLIWDSERPIALAGIMGGYESEINENTKNVLLECAIFSPPLIRRTARRLGISTEASYRFERGVDQLGAENVINRAAYLIHRFGGGQILKGISKNEPKKFKLKNIPFRPKRAISLLSIDAKSEYCLNILNRLGCEILPTDDGKYQVTPPSFRLDLEREIDLVEEVGRFYGLEKIPATLPRITKSAIGRTCTHGVPYEFLYKIKQWARGLGLQECVTYSFVDKDELIFLGEDGSEFVPVANPLSKDQDTMRTLVVTGVLNALKTNIHNFNQDIRLFEIARAFYKDLYSETGVREINKLTMALHGNRYPTNWSLPRQSWDFYDLKGMVENLFKILGIYDKLKLTSTNKYNFLDKGAEILINNIEIGFLGTLRKKYHKQYHVKTGVVLAELDIDKIYSEYKDKQIQFIAWSKYPPVFRDMTIVCPEGLTYEEIRHCLESSKSQLLEEVDLIDLYIPENSQEKRITLRMTYRDPKRTLTDREVDKVHSNLGKYLLEHLPVRFP